ETHVAGDGEDALARLVDRAEHFDAVVLDVMLPGKSGFEVASLLREQKNYVPILMLTARGRAEDVLKGFASGADDYLPKPFELSILIARLEGLLRRSAWTRQTIASEAGGANRAAADRAQVSGHRAADSEPDPELSTGIGPEAELPEADTFTFSGKSIDFAELELRSLGNTIHLTV